MLEEELPLLVEKCPTYPYFENIFMARCGSKNHELFVAECLYGIEFGGLHGGEPAADDADYDENHAGEKHSHERQVEVDVYLAGFVFVGRTEEGQRADGSSKCPREQHSDDSGGDGHHQRFQQKLPPDVSLARA